MVRIQPGFNLTSGLEASHLNRSAGCVRNRVRTLASDAPNQ